MIPFRGLLFLITSLFFISCDGLKKSEPIKAEFSHLNIPDIPGWLQSVPTPEVLKGKAIILNFWASWCAPCREETPSLLKLLQEQSDQIVLLSISGDQSLKEMKKFMSLFPGFKNSGLYVAHDEGRYWIQRYAVTGFPETYVFDNQHKKLKSYKGSVDFLGTEFRELVKAAITKKTD